MEVGPYGRTAGEVKLTPAIIAGGRGTRLWPLSRDGEPKPLLRMAGGHSLLQLTLRRLGALGATEPPLLVCNAEHEQAMHEHASVVGFADMAMILEPEGRNTAAAICAVALWGERRGLADEPFLIMPADHVVSDEARFAIAVEAAVELAALQKIVTFSMKPDRPATAYGYVELGAAIDAARSQFDVRRFVEKPDAGKAAEFLASGRHYWNSGMFVATPATLLAEFQRCRPDILAGMAKAFPAGARGNRVYLEPSVFAKLDSIAFDRAIMEQTASAATVLAEIGWNDVGDWQTMWEVAEKGDRGTAVWGNATAVDMDNSLIRSEGPQLLCIGLEDIVAVASGDAVLVAKRNYAQKIGEIVEQARANTVLLRDIGRKTFFTSREYDLDRGGVRTMEEHRSGFRVFICVAGRGRIATGLHEHALEAGSAVTFVAGKSCRIEANADNFLRVIEIRVDGS
jgi:mannose-1-phosphate guanylyltransferase / mannose-6-phosphate isomerase